MRRTAAVANSWLLGYVAVEILRRFRRISTDRRNVEDRTAAVVTCDPEVSVKLKLQNHEWNLKFTAMRVNPTSDSIITVVTVIYDLGIF